MARAVVGAGLHPALGVHHRNQYNSFALADDLMEPLRPLVDIKVYEVCELLPDTPELTPENKRTWRFRCYEIQLSSFPQKRESSSINKLDSRSSPE